MNFFNLNKNVTSSCINTRTLHPIVPPPLFNEEKKHKPNEKA